MQRVSFFGAPPLALDLHLPSWPEKCKVTDASTTSHLMPARQASSSFLYFLLVSSENLVLHPNHIPYMIKVSILIACLFKSEFKHYQ